MLRYSSQHENIPADCDEFGYLNLAKAIDNGNTFEEHNQRPFLRNLLNEFQTNKLKEIEYVWMIVPHAYHISENTGGKIINQYPPGTSFILSLFPLAYRNLLFPFIAVFLTLMFPLLAFFLFSFKQKHLLIASVCLFVVITIISTPYLSELARVNSLAFSFGILLTAGLLMNKNPYIGLFLVALSGNFRVINLLMTIPFFVYIFYENLPLFKQKKWLPLINVFFKTTTTIIVGILPYLYYSYNLLGNPLTPTHPQHDISFSKNFELLENVSFYLNLNQAWFISHLILLIILFIYYFLKHITLFKLCIWLLFPIINYAFFVFHKVQMDYYPFASSLILTGASIYYLQHVKINLNYKKIITYLPVLFCVAILGDGINRFINKPHLSFNEAKHKLYKLCDYDIVWGEMFCGTSEYICSNTIGFKYAFSSPKAREVAIRYFLQNKYKQVILCDDINMKFSNIEEELTSLNIEYDISNIENIGNVIIIK